MQKVIEQAQFWQVQSLKNLEFMRATYINHTFPRHSHETFGIGIVEQRGSLYQRLLKLATLYGGPLDGEYTHTCLVRDHRCHASFRGSSSLIRLMRGTSSGRDQSSET